MDSLIKACPYLFTVDNSRTESSGPVCQAILIAIITYNGQNCILETVKTLRAVSFNSYPVLILDNASSDQTVSLLESLEDPDLEIKQLGSNLGLGAAYNIALAEAGKRSFRWLFLLDQDSVCRPGCLESLYKQAEDLLHSQKKVGGICAAVYSRAFPDVIHLPYIWDGKSLKPIQRSDKQNIMQIDSSISSGTLYSVNALQDIGGFRADFFIDFVDHECHLRLKKAGWSMWCSWDAWIEHDLGNYQQMTAEGLWIEHEPWRYYYMVRNMVAGYRTHGGHRAMLRFIHEAWLHGKRLKKYGRAPNKCILYMFKGLVHGLQGRLGQLDTKD